MIGTVETVSNLSTSFKCPIRQVSFNTGFIVEIVFQTKDDVTKRKPVKYLQ